MPPFATGRPPGPGHNRTAWIVAGVATVAVLTLGVAVAMIVSGRNTPSPSAQTAPPSMVSALTSGKGTPQSSAPATAPPSAAGLAPVVPGYRPVPIPERGAAYDVPPEWQINPVGTAVWGNPPDTVEVAGLAQDGKDYCPSYIRTNAFLTMSPQADPAAAAADVGARMAKVGWSAAAGATPGRAESLESLDGQLRGVFVETTGSAPPPVPGCATTFSVFAFAFPSENGNFVMTIAADTGVARAIDRSAAKQILASIRPLPDR
ncbi:hypothetical protein [Nocardia sp. BMG51109]|uniref:hypothetical protein n=1 Tax=Nocardia sp. BMG51109 TaxID=1056816 RepID=UPI0012EB0B48|nr:hypothetical protein [Nocardia sp. BMG51109]